VPADLTMFSAVEVEDEIKCFTGNLQMKACGWDIAGLSGISCSGLVEQSMAGLNKAFGKQDSKLVHGSFPIFSVSKVTADIAVTPKNTACLDAVDACT